MKKYISPIAKSLELNYEGIIAVSDPNSIDGGNAGRAFNANDASYSEKRHSIWGEQ